MAAEDDLLALTTGIVAAHVGNNSVALADVPNLIRNVHGALSAIRVAPASDIEAKSPAVPVKASVRPNYVVCLECGSKQSMLKRHLQAAHGLTTWQYRLKYELSEAHPLVAPSYTNRRRELAKEMGLGRKDGLGRGRPKRR